MTGTTRNAVRSRDKIQVARRKKAEPPENHERWLVSYADFITLLFAFFVVMFASSQADHGRAQQVSESVKEAFEENRMSAMIAAVLGGAVDRNGTGNAQMQGPGGTETDDAEREVEEKRDPPELAELLPSLEVLSEELGAEIANGEIQISMTSRGLVISFAQAALFPSGDAEIAPGSFGGLEKVAAAIARIPNPVRLEGHTDSRPINTSRYRSNWELSAARSIALLEILNNRFGVQRGRLSVAGYADTAPVASNDTEEGRGRNRRVDLVVLNEQGMMGEPLKYGDGVLTGDVQNGNVQNGNVQNGDVRIQASAPINTAQNRAPGLQQPSASVPLELVEEGAAPTTGSSPPPVATAPQAP